MDKTIDTPWGYNAHGCLIFSFPGIPGVKCAFSTVSTGTVGLLHEPEKHPQAIESRRKLLAGLGPRHWVELKQVHKDGLLVDPLPTPLETASTREADGACTRQAGLALAIKTADCQPILLTNRQGSAVAAIHAGWRGNAMNFPGSAVERFCAAYGLKPEDLSAVRGPSLGPAAAEFINFDKEWPPAFRPWLDETSKTMDLWGLAREQLIRAGIPARNVFSLDLCTYSLPDLFFSHRRGDLGRQVSLIWIEQQHSNENNSDKGCNTSAINR